MIDKWSKCEYTSVTTVDTTNKKVTLANGKEFSYKALVLAPGLDQDIKFIEGLDLFEDMHDMDGCFSHLLDKAKRTVINSHHGWSHTHGDMLVYGP